MGRQANVGPAGSRLVSELRTIWEEEVALGTAMVPELVIPSEVRELVQHGFLATLDAEGAHITVEVVRRRFPDVARREVAKAILVVRATLAAKTRVPPACGPKRTYRGSRERRMRILQFIAERLLPMGLLRSGVFQPEGLEANWPLVTEEWARAYPDDKLPSKTLKRYFSRIRKEEPDLLAACQERVKADAESLRRSLESMPAEHRQAMESLFLADWVFVKHVTSRGAKQLLTDAQDLLRRAQALRRAGEGVSPAARRAKEETADGLEGSAQTLLRAAQVEEWAVAGSPALRPRRTSQAGRQRREQRGGASRLDRRE